MKLAYRSTIFLRVLIAAALRQAVDDAVQLLLNGVRRWR